MKFNPEYKLSDIVSASSLAIAATTFLVTQCNAFQTRNREYADSVRSAAIQQSAAIRKIKNDVAIVYERAQVAASKADDSLAEKKSPEMASSVLYQNISDLRFTAMAAIREQPPASTYVSAYGYSPCTGKAFDAAISNMTLVASNHLHRLVDTTYALTRAQQASAEGTYSSGQLQATLRPVIRRFRAEFNREIDAVKLPVEQQLTRIINASNEDIRAHDSDLDEAKVCEVLHDQSQDSPANAH